MRLIRPIRACLPDPDLVAEVATPPLGGLTTRDWERLSSSGANSFVHVIRSEMDTAEGGPDPSGGETSGRAKLDELLERGVLHLRESPTFFVYEIVDAGRPARGVVGEVLVDGYRDGRIRRHEHTRKATEDLLVDHLERLGAQTDPVALTYRADREIDAILDEVVQEPPLLDFEAGGVRQRVWEVGLGGAGRLQSAFDRIGVLYITDGHHRCAAAARHAARHDAADPAALGSADHHYVLAAIYPDTQLTLFEFNRCVAEVALDPDALVAELRRGMSVEELPLSVDPKPRHRGEIGMVTGGRSFRLAIPDQLVPDDAYGALDAVLLQDLVLGPVLGIEDPRTDRRLRYVAGPDVPDPAAHGCDVCFLLHPTDLADVMRIADAGMVMPPKSTWFEPKVWGGVFVRLLE